MRQTTNDAPLDSKTVSGNILSLSGCVLVSRGVAFAGTVYLARVLGADAFGIIGFATALLSYAEVTVSAGFDSIGARAVARRPHEASGIAWSVIPIRLALAFVALVIICGGAMWLDMPRGVKLVTALMGLSLFSLAFDTAWVYQGLARSGRPGAAMIASQVLYVSLLFLAVKSSAQVAIVPAAQFLSGMVAALWLAAPLWRSGQFRFDLSEGWAILRSSGFLTVTRLLRALIFSFDVVLIGWMLGERQAGLYAAPYRICLFLLALATTIQVSYLPALTRAWSQGIAQVAGVLRRSMEYFAAVAAPMVIGGIITASPLLKAVFGPDYVEGARPFTLLLLSIGLIFIHSALRNVLIVGDHMKTDLGIVGAAAALNVAFNLVVIPRYGLLGAASVTAASEALILLLGLVATGKLGMRQNLSPVVRPLMAAGIMGAVLLSLGDRPLPLLLSTGAVVYAGVLAAVRGIPQDAQPYVDALACRIRRLLRAKKR
jgi:O-antigen/teichoic acid export membrane protein